MAGWETAPGPAPEAMLPGDVLDDIAAVGIVVLCARAAADRGLPPLGRRAGWRLRRRHVGHGEELDCCEMNHRKVGCCFLFVKMSFLEEC